jgi:exonuclease SbcC
MEKYKALYKEVTDIKKAFETKGEKAENAVERYKEAVRSLRAAQAGRLAQEELEPGKPCPVCGSLEHPNPAKRLEGAYTEAQVDQLFQECSTKHAEVMKLHGRFEQGQTILGERKEALLQSIHVRLGNYTTVEARDHLPEVSAKLDEELTKLEKRLQAKAQDVKRKVELEEKIPQDEKTAAEADARIAEAGAKRASAETARDAAEIAWKEISAKLRFQSKREAEARKNALRAECEKRQNEKKRAEEAVKQQEKKAQELAERIKLLEQSIAEAPQDEFDALRADRTARAGERAGLLNLQKELHKRLENNRKTLDNLQKASGDLGKLELRFQWLKALADTVMGKIGAREKIMLETYVQMRYFERIVARANVRLLVMSGGQYELRRRIEATTKKSLSGLELDVVDHYNGSIRGVETLSGGESFKASLSLALGLADEIQSSAGGVELDTLFVDEGFGSLDDESLEQAMRALASLSDGRRLVGVISHVGALKERIDKKIIVTKAREQGSRVKIEA